MLIKLINPGVGNIISVENWLKLIGVNYSIVTNDNDHGDYGEQILVLPGVANSINYLNSLKEFKNLFNHIQEKRFAKIIGICAGFQVLCQRLEEGGKTEDGFNLIPAISSDTRLPLYNNSWGKTSFSNKIPVTEKERSNVYFNHSCGVFPLSNESAFDLDNRGFAISYHSAKIMGLQFHPEKSGVFGVKLGRYIFDV